MRVLLLTAVSVCTVACAPRSPTIQFLPVNAQTPAERAVKLRRNDGAHEALQVLRSGLIADGGMELVGLALEGRGQERDSWTRLSIWVLFTSFRELNADARWLRATRVELTDAFSREVRCVESAALQFQVRGTDLWLSGAVLISDDEYQSLVTVDVPIGDAGVTLPSCGMGCIQSCQSSEPSCQSRSGSP